MCRNITSRFISCFAVFLFGLGITGNSYAADGWYFSGNVGTSILMETDVTDTFSGGSAKGTADADTGVMVSGAIGHAWDNFRLEAEALYQQADLDTLNVSSATLFGSTFSTNIDLAVDGEASSLGLMVNGWFDVDTGSKWTPYFGGGVGFSRQSIDIKSIAGISTAYDQDAEVISYQAGVGLKYAMSDTTSIGVSYRYFGSQEAEFDDGTDKVESEFSSHIIALGLIHKF